MDVDEQVKQDGGWGNVPSKTCGNMVSKAIEMANKLDIIVLAGKGHEPYQEINGTKYPFDERIIVKEIIG
mgnify:CR=1 FL=1